MSKAYDRIEWDYLRAMLVRLGFNEWWVHLIMQCVRSVRYTIVHGVQEMGPIVPTRGIRQGDPLSPYLFILCAEGLSAFIRKFEVQKLIHGVKICRGAPTLTHMFFADDSHIYCRANVFEATNLNSLLQKFELASGQKVNLGKSSVFFSSNIIRSNREEVCRELQMTEADAGSTYLGLPNMLSRNKTALLGFLKDKVQNRISNWDGRNISKSGKEILIKTVAQTLPSYAMSVFLLPFGIIRDMERCLVKYWWGYNQNHQRGIHWLSWPRLSKHKTAGGMGFQDFRDFNIAMLGKQGWRFLTNPGSLVSRIFKARYFPRCNFLRPS